ncbi:hypothetical protein [Bifidobacterium breve]|uniref:hypothetical protein n=1 Tax=Bifidobacterium breve TaxID=1685 RepID=UPI0012FEEB29|nr:hypothetical protein [Bifidobacterium breve]
MKKPGSPPHGGVIFVGQLHDRLLDVYHVSRASLEFDADATGVARIESQEDVVRAVDGIQDGGLIRVVASVDGVDGAYLSGTWLVRPQEAGEHEISVFRHRKIEAVSAGASCDLQLM